MSDYFKYRIPYELLYNKINSSQVKVQQINFFIDLPSIARGLYNKYTISHEINTYLETKQMPTLMIDELRVFLNNLYSKFKYYNPKFIIFFDNGKSIQTKSLDSDYKADRSSAYNKILEDEEREIHRAIKNYYFSKIEEDFHKPGLCAVIYDKQYEMDCLAYYVISKNHCNSQSQSTLNFIFSTDKDLLQTCEFENTFQATSIYVKKQIKMDLWDKHNCIKYIYPKFLTGILTAKHIPLLLAIAGDKADNIKNITAGMGIAHAVEVVSNGGVPPIFTENYILPPKLEPYKKKILDNLKLTSFELQIQRIQEPDLIYIDNRLNIF